MIAVNADRAPSVRELVRRIPEAGLSPAQLRVIGRVCLRRARQIQGAEPPGTGGPRASAKNPVRPRV